MSARELKFTDVGGLLVVQPHECEIFYIGGGICACWKCGKETPLVEREFLATEMQSAVANDVPK